jgi:dienelactone hydrolase
MADVLLFHPILGLRDAVREFAAGLRDAGHSVRVPDLYDGRVLESIEAGARVRDEIGIPELLRRATTAADDAPRESVVAGFSMGGWIAQWLAATRPGARGALLLHHAAPLAELELEAWPEGVPVAVHRSEHDTYVGAAEVEQMGIEVRAAGAAFEDFVYPGTAHLFADPGLDGYDLGSAALMSERALAFVARVG